MADDAPAPSKATLVAAQTALQAQVQAQLQQVAINDLPFLTAAQTALNDPSVATLVTALTNAQAGMVDPNRIDQVGYVVQVITNVLNNLAQMVPAAQTLANPPAPAS